MIAIRKTEERWNGGKATWFLVIRKDEVTGEKKNGAMLNCSLCGETAGLADHEIKDGGEVNPSVVCPNEKCDFHDHIKLEHWKP